MAEDAKPEWAAVGKRLRQIEIAEGKNGNRIADELGISRQSWSKYKNGKRELPIWIAAELRKLYGVSLEWLFLDEFHRNSDEFKQRLAARQRASAAGPRPSKEPLRRRA
jgi:transcriptional regulator with XRE-family HTH domain